MNNEEQTLRKLFEQADIQLPKNTVFSKQDWVDLYSTLIDWKRRVILRHSGGKEWEKRPMGT